MICLEALYVTDFLLRLLKAGLSSLYVFLGRVPAFELLRRSFGWEEGSSNAGAIVVAVIIAALVGVALFVLFWIFLRNAPVDRGGDKLRRLFR